MQDIHDTEESECWVQSIEQAVHVATKQAAKGKSVNVSFQGVELRSGTAAPSAIKVTTACRRLSSQAIASSIVHPRELKRQAMLSKKEAKRMAAEDKRRQMENKKMLRQANAKTAGSYIDVAGRNPLYSSNSNATIVLDDNGPLPYTATMKKTILTKMELLALEKREEHERQQLEDDLAVLDQLGNDEDDAQSADSSDDVTENDEEQKDAQGPHGEDW